jgi:DNA phosphorothioation-dependent restriction protein DptH
MALLSRLVKTPLQELLGKLDIAKLCHVPTEYVLDGKTRAEALESDSKADVTSDNVHQEIGDSEVKLNTEAEERCSEAEGDQTAPEIDVSMQGASKGVDTFKAKPSGTNLNVLFGHNALTQAPLTWEPTNTAKFMNTNTGIIGTMGTGKTQFTKSVITQLYRNQADNVNSASIGILIFDYKSDYVDDKFQQTTSGKKFKLHKLPYNPLTLFGDTPMLPVHTARGFSETMGKAFNLGQKQQLRLRKLVAEAYESAGIYKADPGTWTKSAPTIADVWSLFIENEPDEDSLYAALESLYDLEIFEDDHTKCMSLYDLVDGVRVVELAGYPSEIQNLVVALTLDLFYSQMQKKGKPEVQGDFRQITKMILVDEADNFMSQNFPSLRKILKEGREYGVGVILSTQDITHFQTGDNDYSNYVLTWVIHRVSKIRSQELKAIFGVNEKLEQSRLMDTISKLEKHYSLFIDGSKKFLKMRDLAFWELDKKI